MNSTLRSLFYQAKTTHEPPLLWGQIHWSRRWPNRYVAHCGWHLVSLAPLAEVISRSFKSQPLLGLNRGRSGRLSLERSQTSSRLRVACSRHRRVRQIVLSFQLRGDELEAPVPDLGTRKWSPHSDARIPSDRS